MPDQEPVSQQIQQSFELLTAEQLAVRLAVPKTWLLEQTRSRAEDPAPHWKLGKYVRFSLDADFYKWLERHKKRGGQ
jgi:hypothetical protein